MLGRTTAVLMVVCLLAPAAMGARYIVVWKEGEGPAPDLARFGATGSAHDRVEVTLDDDALTSLRAHPRVAFIQEVLAPGALARDQILSAADVPVAVNGGAPGSWQSGDYAFDGAGDILRIGENDYAYDALGRLVRADVRSNGALTTDVYRYDAYGNLHRRTTTGPGGTSELSMPVSWATNRQTGATYTGGGDVKTRPGAAHTYDWDALHMMSGLTAPGRNDVFVYTPSDDRIAVRSGTLWKWSFRNLSGKVVRRYESTDGGPWLWIEDVVHREAAVAGTERPAAQGGRRHFHLDHLGTPRLITDHAGRGISQHDYLPFGIELTSIRQEQDRGIAAENVFRFTGHERDFVGGTVVENTEYIDYMRARYYVPTMARFLSVDPGGMNAAQPQSWNRYSYVQGNPVTRLDPDGRDWRHFLDIVRTKFSNAYEHLKKADEHFSNTPVFKVGGNLRLCCAEGKAGPARGGLRIDLAPRVDDNGTVTVSLRARLTAGLTPNTEFGPRGTAELTVFKEGSLTADLKFKREGWFGNDQTNVKTSSSGELTANVSWMGLNAEAGMNVFEAGQGLTELNLGLTELANDWFSIKQQEEPLDESDGGILGYYKTGNGKGH